MPDLLRRVAVRTVVFAAAMAVVVPLSVRSATPVLAETKRLLAAATNASALDRGLSGREFSAALSLQEVPLPISVEALAPPSLLVPGSVLPAVTFGALPTPVPRPHVRIVPTPVSGSAVAGAATWYCCSAGWRGEAVVALPGALGGHYDPPPAGRYVTVCAQRCAKLPVADYCDCYWGTASERVADLSPEAWAAISDADRNVVGIIQVTVHL